MPDPTRRARSEALELFRRLVTTLELRTDVAIARRLHDRDPEPDVHLVRDLDLRHLGRWIYLPGRPASLGRPVQLEPSLAAIAGRLVGIRQGDPGTPTGPHARPSRRTLVLQQGATTTEYHVDVAERVDVAPRDWN